MNEVYGGDCRCFGSAKSHRILTVTSRRSACRCPGARKPVALHRQVSSPGMKYPVELSEGPDRRQDSYAIPRPVHKPGAPAGRKRGRAHGLPRPFISQAGALVAKIGVGSRCAGGRLRAVAPKVNLLPPQKNKAPPGGGAYCLCNGLFWEPYISH